MPARSRHATLPLIRQALQEDAAFADVTSRIVLPPTARVHARVIAKESGVIAGTALAASVFHAVERSLRCRVACRDGQSVRPGQLLLTVEGNARAIFAAERVALNLLGHLSGIATLTRAFVGRVRGTRAKILDTRKTLPGLRELQKYAVRCGGGYNHRMDLSDEVLIKTNHLRAAQCGMRNAECGMVIRRLIQSAKQRSRGRFVEIEVANLREFRAALVARPDAILLDNWSIRDIQKAVRARNSALRTPHSAFSLLEVSGGVTLTNVRAIAKTGVDRISIGRLTHSAPALDVSLEVIR